MRRALLCVIAFSIVTSLFGQTSSNAAGEAAVRDVVQKYMDARDHRDATALAALFTVDVDQLVSTGEWRRGRDEVVKGTLGSSQSTGGKRSITVESVRFLARDVALADGRYELTGLANGETRKMWTTILLKHGPDGWHIAAIRNMLPAPTARITLTHVPDK
ncbi:MAG: SgcJ/EcaC family oxidoreductase [Bryobacteraceae bacterium]